MLPLNRTLFRLNRRRPSNTLYNNKEDDLEPRTRYEQNGSEKKLKPAQKKSHVSESEKIKFKRRLPEKEIKINLFILEGEPGFESLNLRKKMTKVISLGCEELKGWFYECGIDETLPKTWDEFKIEFAIFVQVRVLIH